MASEGRRACGYRKVGGLYLVGKGTGFPCCKLPIKLHVCPTCNQGVKQTRGWQWIDPRPWLAGDCTARGPMRGLCPAADPKGLGEKVGLLWIGASFYPKPEVFTEEASRMGISRRLKAIPRGFKLGEHYVFLAHPKLFPYIETGPDGDEQKWHGGVFRIFKPDAIEQIVTKSDMKDETKMEALREKGITPVAVEDDDKDHQGSVHDDDNGDLFEEGAP